MTRKSNIRDFWYAYIFSVILLFTIAVVYRVSSPVDQPSAPSPAPTRFPSKGSYPTPTPYYKPSLADPVPGQSYGIFYPYNDGVVVNNPRPQIIGKVSQQSGIFLATRFGRETSPVSYEEEYFLRFLPGRTTGLKLTVDGVEITPVYGIAQYPTVLCKTSRTEEECLSARSSDLPPLIFFAHITNDLSEGRHTLAVKGPGVSGSMTFTVKSDYHLPAQNIFPAAAAAEYQRGLIISDSCPPGYYYDKNYLKYPLPLFDNHNLYYLLAFPKPAGSAGSTRTGRIQIEFSGTRFDLFFPSGQIFHEGRSEYESMIDRHLSPDHQLFLPIDQLVFTDGSKAGYTGNFEVFPVDTAGGTYPGRSIPWTIVTHSGCDG